MWTLDIGVPTSDKYDLFEVSNYIEDGIIGELADQVGAGFGFRDMQFDSFRTYEEVMIMVRRVKRYLRDRNIPVQKVFDVDSKEAYVECYSYMQLP